MPTATLPPPPRAAVPPPVPRLWTADQFLDWLEPGLHADLIDGEKFMHSPVNFRHARLLNFVDRLLAGYIEAHQLGELHREIVAVRLGSRNVFLPDLAFFTSEQVPRLLDTHAPFAPAFVLEALSPRTADRDLGPKFAAYEEHGVNEYWVLDPDHAQHQFYRREGELLVEFARTGEKIKSAVIRGFWVKRSWLNPEKLPAVQTCLAELLR